MKKNKSLSGFTRFIDYQLRLKFGYYNYFDIKTLSKELLIPYSTFYQYYSERRFYRRMELNNFIKICAYFEIEVSEALKQIKCFNLLSKDEFDDEIWNLPK